MWCWVPTTSVGGRLVLEYSWARGAPVLASLATAATHSLLLEINRTLINEVWLVFTFKGGSKVFLYFSLRDTEEEKKTSFRLKQEWFDSH